MIVLGSRDIKSIKKLKERKVYVQSLLNEGRPNVSPSSQEWVSDEYYQGHRHLLMEEIQEIDTLITKLQKEKK